ncbi:hypothetical protein VD0002_g5756 [Verticillium dahliae]|nr:hypothetical protein VD0003_g7191 [Verticillium dahliae]PNH62257.1 hypothetical protein VD0002_g5756 [Verticillium dahliae]
MPRLAARSSAEAPEEAPPGCMVAAPFDLSPSAAAT